jgi:hypothetical protein
MKHCFTIFLLGSALSAAAAPDAPGVVINEVEGWPMEMDIVTSGYYASAELEYFTDMRRGSEVVMGDDALYLKDPIPLMAMEAYVRAEMDEDTGDFVVKLPQTMYADEEMWFDLVLTHMDEETGMPEIIEGDLIFIYNDDGSLTMQDLGEGNAVALWNYPDDMWAGFSETAISYCSPEETEVPVVMPEGAEIQKYAYSTYGYGQYDPSVKPDFGYRVDVAFENGEVYIAGLSYDDPSICIKGELNGDKIVIPNNQYIGVVSGVYSCHVAFAKKDAASYGGYALLPEDSVLTLNYDAEKGIIEEDGTGVAMMFNLTPNNNENGILYLQMYDALRLVYQPTAAGAPIAPTGLMNVSEGGRSLFDFNLPTVTEDGTVLDRSNMYYNIFIDDEIFEFDADEYNLTESVEDMPYLFTNKPIVSTKYSTFHEILMMVEGYDTIGVQCFNVYDGVTYAGPKATFDVATGEVTVTTGVDGVTADGAPAQVIYYDLSGRKVANPAAGIFVRQTINEDGSVTVDKVIRK